MKNNSEHRKSRILEKSGNATSSTKYSTMLLTKHMLVSYPTFLLTWAIKVEKF